MENFKGTPGPYSYRSDVIGTSFYIETEDMSHKNTFIGEIGGGLQSKSEIEANAKLHAASFDISAALYQLIHLHGCEQEGLSSGQPSQKDWLEAYDTGVAALGKAGLLP